MVVPQLPVEIIEQIGCYHSETYSEKARKTVLSLTKTCRQFNQLFSPLLYRAIHLQTLPPEHQIMLVRTLRSNATLVRMVEDLTFSNNYYLQSGTPWRMECKIIDAECGNGFKGMVAKVHNALLATLPHLRAARWINEPYNLYQGPWLSSVKEVTLSIDHQSRSPRVLNRILPLFTSPSIEYVFIHNGHGDSGAIEAFRLPDEEQDHGMDRNISNVIYLSIYALHLSTTTFDGIIGLPKALRALVFNVREMDFWRVDQIDFTEIQACLKKQEKTLEHLEIRLPYPIRDHDHETSYMMTLRFLCSLTSLTISTEMLLGYQDCGHMDPLIEDLHIDSTEYSRDPECFGSVLPVTLEELTLWIDTCYSVRNGPDHMLKAIQSIVDLKETFTELKIIEIRMSKLTTPAGGICPGCYDKSRRDMKSAISIEELREIKSICDEIGITFVAADICLPDEGGVLQLHNLPFKSIPRLTRMCEIVQRAERETLQTHHSLAMLDRSIDPRLGTNWRPLQMRYLNRANQDWSHLNDLYASTGLFIHHRRE